MTANGRARAVRSLLLAAVVAIAAAVAAGMFVAAVWLGDLDARRFTGLEPPPPADEYGTAREVGTWGDDPNPGARYAGRYPSDAETQERAVGGAPARLSGYTTWVHAVERVPAADLVDGYRGDYLRVRVTVFNRDRERQPAGARDFRVWRRGAGRRTADFVGAPVLPRAAGLASGATLEGDVYFYVGDAGGARDPRGLFLEYAPDAGRLLGSHAHGVWLLSPPEDREGEAEG